MIHRNERLARYRLHSALAHAHVASYHFADISTGDFDTRPLDISDLHALDDLVAALALAVDADDFGVAEEAVLDSDVVVRLANTIDTACIEVPHFTVTDLRIRVQKYNSSAVPRITTNQLA